MPSTVDLCSLHLSWYMLVMLYTKVQTHRLISCSCELVYTIYLQQIKQVEFEHHCACMF